jgi:hypothetical protein
LGVYAPSLFCQFTGPGVKKSGFFRRGLLGTGAFLGSETFLVPGLAAVFVPPAFLTVFALAAAPAFGTILTAFGFLGITVNSSAFPQWGHFAMVFSPYLKFLIFNIGRKILSL